MISNRDLFKEIQALESIRANLPNKYEDAMLKAQILQIKLLANMRTNQALALKGSGIDLIPRRIESEQTAHSPEDQEMY